MHHSTETDARNADPKVTTLRPKQDPESNVRAALHDLVAIHGLSVGTLSPIICGVDPLLSVRTFIEALAAANLTIYRNPYDAQVPLLICTTERAAEIGEAVRATEAARHRMLDAGMEP